MLLQCLLFYLNVCLSIAMSITLDSPPLRVIMKEGDPLEIICPESDNYRFFYPESANGIETSPVKLSIISSFKTFNVLIRDKTVYGDTGWYGCINSNNQVYNHQQSREYRVYVYVHSPTKLLVNRNDSMNYLLGQTNEKVTIPCRPNSPNYTIELLHDEQMVPIFGRVQYQPTEGFSIYNLTLKDIGQYSCKVRSFTHEEETSFYLLITSKEKKINQPIIQNHNGQVIATKGQNLALNCSVEIESNILFSLNWLTPRGGNTTQKYFENSLGVNYYQKLKELTVENVSENDEGYYGCCIDSDSTHKCATIFIAVKDSREFLNITSRVSSIIYEKKCNQQITWIIEYHANPSPQISWIHPNNEPIQNNSNKYFITEKPGKVIININSLSGSDSGTHKLILKNRIGVVEIPFNLWVSCDY